MSIPPEANGPVFTVKSPTRTGAALSAEAAVEPSPARPVAAAACMKSRLLILMISS
jgi:hypothetical protein